MKPIRFSPKQKQMLNAPFMTWNIYAGAVRSGKSFGTMFLIPKRILNHYKEPCLFVGKTLATIERNVLRPLREIFGAVDIGEIKSRQDGGRYVYIYGKEVDCVGANDDRAISKIHGAEYGYVYIDEATLMPENFFRMLQSRLSLPDSCADLTCNPDSPSHFLKQFIDSEAFQGNYIHFSIYDNPFLPADYVKRLEGEYRGTIYFDRWILGEWVLSEGLCYPLFKRERHLITPDNFQRKTGNTSANVRYLIVGGDGATTNDATALVPLLIFADGSAAVGDIFYHNPKENGQLANADIVPRMAEWYDEIIRKYNIGYQVPIYTAVDCAAADLVVTMRNRLPSRYRITSMTQKSLTQTTDIVNNALARDAIHLLDFGGYRNYIRNRWVECTHPLVKELETMIWDKNDGTKYDDSVPNDVADAFRYAVCTYFNNPDNIWVTPTWGV